MFAWLDDPLFLITWLSGTAVALAILIRDLSRNNSHLMPLMKLVWVLTVLYSGLLGLAIYYYSGRKEIPRDSLYRRGFRSVAHCYSGCGFGEVTGLLIAVGLLGLSTWWVAGLTFSLAFLAGYALTALPMIQAGERPSVAWRDALYTETGSIAVMEIVAIGVDLWLGGDADWGQVRFWSAMLVSLSIGLLAAYPVNLLLIQYGVKAGMHNPKEVANGHRGDGYGQ